MTGEVPLERLRVAGSLAGVRAAEWNALAGANPFLRHEFLSALLETGCADALPAFVLFARADIEAIVGFHRDDIAPVWRTFFEAFQGRVACGERQLRPFEPKPVPPFVPVRLEPQEVIQEVDGQAGPALSGSEQGS